MTECPKIYDIATDEVRDVTQADVDKMLEFIRAASMHPRRAKPVPPRDTEHSFDFKLAIYLNPMRDDGVFIAEEREIESYDGLTWNGMPTYPAVPKTPWRLTQQVEPNFAAEIVRRWNAGCQK